MRETTTWTTQCRSEAALTVLPDLRIGALFDEYTHAPVAEYVVSLDPALDSVSAQAEGAARHHDS
jgi:hypothetical protein